MDNKGIMMGLETFKGKHTLTRNEIWAVRKGEKRPPVWMYLLIMAGLVAVGFVVGAYGSLTFPLGFGVNNFWFGIVVQQVGGVWFGGWGVIAAAIFPIFSNAVVRTPIYVSLAYIPANAVQAFLPAWVFRKYKLDPRLRSSRDYLIFFVSMVLSSLFGALWSTLVVLRSYGLLTVESVPQFIWGWFMGNVLAGLVLNFIGLKGLSSFILRTNLFVKHWFE